MSRTIRYTPETAWLNEQTMKFEARTAFDLFCDDVLMFAQARVSMGYVASVVEGDTQRDVFVTVRNGIVAVRRLGHDEGHLVLSDTTQGTACEVVQALKDAWERTTA